MPTTFRAALACAAMLICALIPASASAAGAPRDLLVAHTDGRLTVEKAGRARAASAGRAGVRFVEPNYRYAATSVPTDELFGEQWSLADVTPLVLDHFQVR